MANEAVEAPGGLSQVKWRPPVLRGARLLLRGYEPSDAAAITGYASDAETTRYVSWNTHTSSAGAIVFLDGWVAESYRRQQLDYAICLAERPDRIIGGVGALVVSVQHKVMEIGYILERGYWGRGLVAEAGRLVIDEAFASTDVQRIAAPILAENGRSRAVAGKLGMTLDGVLRSALLLRGRRWDQAVYSIVRAEWTGRG